ncbi:MAG: hypothetical protein AB8B65_19095 [Kordia sp.]
MSCKNLKDTHQHEKKKNIISEWSETKKDSLIVALANMKTDTLDCTADAYWQIIGQGNSIIPNLLTHLTDTTTTNIYYVCKEGNLNIGELSYFALNTISDFPASMVTQIQFDLVYRKNEAPCWNFYRYFFNNENKAHYQEKAISFYEKSKFKFVKYSNSEITNCMKKYNIKGKYIIKSSE